jgi:murein DD-endopeptidase MepM/ murein hydrolase activator NlpD
LRAHKGVDTAHGTPVRAAGDLPQFAGCKGGYGNVLEIAHPRGVVTVYGHLALRQGRVHRTKVTWAASSLVGMSGSPRPNLHYEYRVNGVHKNPQTVEPPGAAPDRSGLARDFTPTALALAALEVPIGPALVSR